MPDSSRGGLHYHRLPDDFAKDEKLGFLATEQLRGVEWQRLNPNAKYTWLVSDTEAEFESFLSIGSKQAKRAKPTALDTIFQSYCSGAVTRRDMWAYDFGERKLLKRMKKFVTDYNTQAFLYSQEDPKPPVDEFVDYETVKWDSMLKGNLRRGKFGTYSDNFLRLAMYRPYSKKHTYFDPLFISSVCLHPYYFPNAQSEVENRIITTSDIGYRARQFSAFISNVIPDTHLNSSVDAHQCFPFYTYDRDGSNRRENITDFALARFRERYADPRINKWDIFHYVYALLHHPGYRARYALDLKRSLPRIPFVPSPRLDGGTEGGHASPRPDGGTEGGQGGFHAFAEAGRRLADLHLHYERAEPYPLEWDTGGKTIDFRVERMRPLGKRAAEDGDWKVFDSLKYNDTLTLRGIPERAFAYRLGNRSALEWVVDQWRVKHDKRSGITHDANDYSDDEQYVVRLVERVVGVSLRTMDVVAGLAGLGFR